MRLVRFLLLSALLLLPVMGWAQAGTTSLRGTITDPKGAVIAGAEVTLSNPTIAFSRTVKTTASGEYVFVQLPPATYTLTATAEGFSAGKVDALVLQVAQPSTINLSLAVKGQTTVIEVSSTAPLVNTTDASIGNAFNANQLINLPSEGRDPAAILSLQAGVVYLGNNVSQEGNAQLFGDSRGGAVSGARSDQTNITLDGLDNNDQLKGLAFEGALRTTLDSLQEFRVTTTNANADQGRSSGAQVNLVTKAGTNNFHGSLYEYHRPTVTAANDAFVKKSQVENGLANIPPKILRNTFGGSIGGPIKKDRLFFFAAYEGMRKAEGQSVTRTIPSDALRQGILQYPCDVDDPADPTDSFDPNCNTGNPLVSDVNGTLVATLMPADIITMDPSCTGNGSCPLGPGPNPAVLSYWTSYGSVSANSDLVGDVFNLRGFTFAGQNPEKNDTYILKLDYKLTPSGNHTLFVRGNLQNDHESTPPQFPDADPNEVNTNNSKGIAAGYTAVLGPNLVNNFRYAFVRQGYGTGGLTTGGVVVNFRGVDEPTPLFERTALVNVPVHNFANDTTWTTGKHTIQFGTNWRFISNNRVGDGSNYSSVVTNAFWTGPAGIANTTGSAPPDLDPVDFGFPAVDPGFGVSYDFAAMALMGILSENNVNFSNDKTGTTITPGALIPRHFKSYEAEFYIQDSWRIRPSLTLTGGLRWTLLQPIYEGTGNQVCPTFGLHEWFRRRGEGAAQGIVDQPTISLDLCGNSNDRASYWRWDYRDLGPRVAFAWSPRSDHGVLHAMFGNNGVLRGGYGIYYDHFGHGIANTFDRTGSFGLTTVVTNPASVQNVDCAPRFSAPGVLPTGTFCGQNLSPASPIAGGYPVTPPTGFNDGSFAIYWGMDDALKTPYAHVFNLSYERELPGNLVFSATYQGRLARRLLQELDLAQPLNLVDPASGMSYYEAASALSALGESSTDISAVQPIPFWENLFPLAAGVGLNSACVPGSDPTFSTNYTATQNFYDLYECFPHNETVGLLIFDLFDFPSFLNGQPFQFFNDQFSSLYSWASIGNSSYHGLQMTLRRPMSKGLQFDFNYTFSKSIDIGSSAERISLFEGFGFASQVINAWMPNQLRAPSDYDLRHQINANWVYELPWGRGRTYGSGWNKAADAVIGGWQVSGLFRWTSGFPFFVGGGEGWATNWELQGSSIRIGDPGPTGTFTDADGDPNMFQNTDQALTAFRGTRPGESGQRNNLRGPGYFGVDLGVSKKWKLTESSTLGFYWETFNLTNSVRFDAAQGAAQNDFLTTSSVFGKYLNTLTKPRVMQFALRLTF